MNVLRLGALWLLSLALTGGAVFCLFFGLRCLVEATTYPLSFRARLSALILTATFFAAAGLMGFGVVWALGRIF
ncbi:MAG: hypothetical protein H7Y12_09410 [Sphingobacteriaceae bacterium]|nr:hypothetical protein [Cytophagaceae bacterium]